MEITFHDKKLMKMANNDRTAVKELGSRRAKLFKERLDDLRDAATLEEVRYLPGHYHELTENRKGQWACDLDQPYRLIFQPHEVPIPEDKNGRYIWLEITGVEILEINNYHGK